MKLQNSWECDVVGSGLGEVRGWQIIKTPGMSKRVVDRTQNELSTIANMALGVPGHPKHSRASLVNRSCGFQHESG